MSLSLPTMPFALMAMVQYLYHFSILYNIFNKFFLISWQLVVLATGGTGNITYLVNDKEVSLDSDHTVYVHSGAYSVNVRDSQGCELALPISATVSQPAGNYIYYYYYYYCYYLKIGTKYFV